MDTATATHFPPPIELVPDGDGYRLRYNLHAGQLRVMASSARFVAAIAGTQSGKSLAIDTPIPTPNGFVQIGDLTVGDTVFDDQGRPVPVTAVSPIFYGRDCCRVRFDDGASIVADVEHLWETSTFKQRKNAARHALVVNGSWVERRPQCRRTSCRSIVSTAQIAATISHDESHTNHSVRLCLPVQCPEQPLPIPPYTLGAWLGDGTSAWSSLTCADAEILDFIREEGISVGSPKGCNSGKAKSYHLGGSGVRGGDSSMPARQNCLNAKLSRLNLLRNKHIPDCYLFASGEQRLALLQGLMDTDGTVGRYCEFSNSNENLARGVLHLARSLGIKARIRSRIPKLYGKECSVSFRVCFSTTLPVFRLPRKLARIKVMVREDALNRYVVAVEKTVSVPVRCISVSSESRLYLCGDAFIPTHNTEIGPPWLYREMQRRGPGDYFVVTPTYPLLELKALPKFLQTFDQHLRLGTYRAGPTRRFRLSAEGSRRLFDRETDEPTTVFFGYAEDPESLESATAKAAWLDEAGQKRFRLGSWEAIQRRLAVHQGRALITTTPYDLGWLKRQFYDRWQAGDPDYDVIRFESIENPAFPPEEWERAKRTLPRWKFDLFYRAIFGRPAGVIYDCFDPDEHAGPRFAVPDSWRRFLGLDFGGVNTAGVFLAEEPATRRLYVYREYLAGGRTAKQHAAALLDGEPMTPVCVGGSHSEQQWRDEFRAAGLPVREPAVKDVEVGIQRVYGSIKTGRLSVFADLARLLDEFASYSRPTDAAGEPTEGIENKNDYHCADALRYIVGWLERGGPVLPDSTGAGKSIIDQLPRGVFIGAGEDDD